jgi:hypothetical protein
MKLIHLIIAAVVFIVLAEVIGSAIRSGGDPDALLGIAAPQETSMGPESMQMATTAWGAEDPVVTFGAFLPRGNATAEEVVSALREVSHAYPDQVRVEVLDMTQDIVRESMSARGLRTPLLTLDGKTEFTVVLEGREEKIDLGDVARLKSLPMLDVLTQIVEQQVLAGGPGERNDRRPEGILSLPREAGG